MQTLDKSSKAIYPFNLDPTITRDQGRNSKKENSPANPTIEEMAKNVQFLGIPFGIEPLKRHPQDYFRFGRIRFRLKNEAGQFFNPEITNKTELANKLGALMITNAPKIEAAKTTGKGSGKGKKN